MIPGLNTGWTYQKNGADLVYIPKLIEDNASKNLFEDLLKTTEWSQGKIVLFGKTHQEPRLSAWYGDPNAHYTYSNRQLTPLRWNDTLLQLKHQLEKICETTFNSVLLNLYRDGQDGMGWHQDNELELGPEPCIASLSLGASRTFKLKHLQMDEKLSFDLEAGSLLIMKRSTQSFWKHALPKTKKDCSARINLTFRKIYPQ